MTRLRRRGRCWSWSLAALLGACGSDPVRSTAARPAARPAPVVTAGHAAGTRAAASSVPADAADRVESMPPREPPSAPRHPTRVVASDLRGCALFDNGMLQCWGGFNFDGELGLGHARTVKVPGWVQGIRGAVEVTLGEHATCAIVVSGALLCWGRAIPDMPLPRVPVTQPAAVRGMTRVTDVALGSDHACAIDAAGATFCWGSNAAGQLGLGQEALGVVQRAPARVGALPPAAGILAARNATVAWTRAGELFIWGRVGSTDTPWNYPSPHRVAGVAGVERAFLSRDHTCALRTDRQLRCFTHETLASFEAGREHDFGPEFAALARALLKAGARPTKRNKRRLWGPLVFPDGRGLADVVDVAVFNHDASAVTATGEVHSWGNPERGTVGRPVDSKGFFPPTRIEGIVDAVAIAGSFVHRCALDRAGGVFCFGRGGGGRLGTDSPLPATKAVRVAGLPRIIQLASNSHCTFALGEDHVLYAWGTSWVNACGLDDDGQTPTRGPVAVPLAPWLD